MVSASTNQNVVTVTGISGYIGSHVGRAFLRDGGWQVRGTVRDPGNEKKIGPLRTAFGDDFSKITLVAADLLDADSIMKAIEGSTHVAHVASPFVIAEPKHEDELIRPAVEGTLAVLKACAKHGVKRVVLTSSIASVQDTHPDNEPDDDIYTEEHWSDPDRPEGMQAYSKSKVLAEKAAWEYVASLPEDERFELSVINPGLVVGPTLIKGEFASAEIITNIMMNKFPALPKLCFSLVDVREVAQAHVNAIKEDSAQGKRFLLTNESLWFSKVAEVLHAEFPGHNITTYEAKYCLVKFFALFDKGAAAAARYWGLHKEFNNSRSREVLKIQYRPAQDSLREMGYSLIHYGMVANKGGLSEAVLAEK